MGKKSPIQYFRGEKFHHLSENSVYQVWTFSSGGLLSPRHVLRSVVTRSLKSLTQRSGHCQEKPLQNALICSLGGWICLGVRKKETNKKKTPNLKPVWQLDDWARVVKHWMVAKDIQGLPYKCCLYWQLSMFSSLCFSILSPSFLASNRWDFSPAIRCTICDFVFFAVGMLNAVAL